MSLRGLTPSQTVGPFFHGGLLSAPLNVLATPQTPGERIRIEGRILDGDRAPVPDAMVEVWQADAAGRYRHPLDAGAAAAADGFTGFGRCGTDEAGAFWFETIRPGRVPAPGAGLQAPHLNVAVFARGLLDHLVTRLYFEDEAANATDPVLALVPPGRRGTLLARRVAADGRTVYRFDIILQGEGETVFFEL